MDKIQKYFLILVAAIFTLLFTSTEASESIIISNKMAGNTKCSIYAKTAEGGSVLMRTINPLRAGKSSTFTITARMWDSVDNRSESGRALGVSDVMCTVLSMSGNYFESICHTPEECTLERGGGKSIQLNIVAPDEEGDVLNPVK